MAIEPALTPRDLQALLQLAPSTFARWQAEGRFKRFELQPRLGRLHRYSRVAVEAYLNREGAAAFQKVG